MARPAPGPMGTDWRRTISGESTTRTSASSSFAASASQVPWTSNVSPAARVISSGPRSSPWRWIARITRSPLLATMPGNTGMPMASERGGIISSATPTSPLMSEPGPFAARGSADGASAFALREPWMADGGPLRTSTSSVLNVASVAEPPPLAWTPPARCRDRLPGSALRAVVRSAGIRVPPAGGPVPLVDGSA